MNLSLLHSYDRDCAKIELFAKFCYDLSNVNLLHNHILKIIILYEKSVYKKKNEKDIQKKVKRTKKRKRKISFLPLAMPIEIVYIVYRVNCLLISK